MILDSQLCFDAGVAITVTRVSTNIIDLGVGRDLGVAGEDHPIKVFVLSDGLFNAGGAATLDILVEGAPDNGSGSPGTYTTFASIPALTITELNSVKPDARAMTIDLPRRRDNANPPRFLRLTYTVATGPFTAGSVQAYLNLGVDENYSYPSGFSTAGIRA